MSDSVTRDPDELARAAAAASFAEPVSVSGYLLVATAVDRDGDDTWVYRFDPGTPALVKLALARLAQFLSDEVVRSWVAVDEVDGDGS